MELSIQSWAIILAIMLLSNTITFLLLWFSLSTNGRKTPLGMVTSSLKVYYLINLTRNKAYYKLEDIENKHIWYTDWDRGVGYGYMKKPLKLGDQIHVIAPNNKVHILIVYSVQTPDAENANFFIFRTFYMGKRNARKPRKPEEYRIPESFQRYYEP